MIENRLSMLVSYLGGYEDGAILISSPENRFYFSGFTGSAGFLVITPFRRILLTDGRYEDQARQETKDFEIITQSTPDKLHEITRECDIKTWIYEDMHLTVAMADKLRSAFSGSEMSAAGQAFSSMRQIKDSTEIQKISRAAELLDQAFTYILEHIGIGVSEIEIAAKLEMFLRKNGSSGTPFDTIIASGARSALPHATATSKVITYGDLVVMDFGCTLDGYCGDMTRTVAVGDISDRQKEIYTATLYAQARALDALKIGMPAAQLDSYARECLESFGFKDEFCHGLGHGVGILVHEKPSVGVISKDILSENSVITIEPGLYLKDQFGVRIEDMVLVGNDHPLTKSSKELIIL